MTKKIDILGIQLDNHSVREAMRKVETYLGNQELNTIEKVSSGMLIGSEQDPVLKEMIKNLDLALIGEKEILKVAGIDTMQRIRETEENDFFFAFFDRMEKDGKKMFLLAETSEQLADAKAKLTELFPELAIDGTFALSECVGNEEAVINEINALTPDVIISVVSSPRQEHFFMEHKDKIGANLWYGLGNLDATFSKRNMRTFFSGLIHFGRLKSISGKYQE
jgi:N-acetylglucosaminyldiphosphoundecaprenol N-acetyl-beta-D-mannosaminyltransferase